MKNNGQKMNTNRKTAIIVGVLYIVGSRFSGQSFSE